MDTNFPMLPRSLNLITPVTLANKVSSLPRPTFGPGLIRVPRCRTMIDPPGTNCPPKAFTPSRCAFESRPFRELPRPFLCAIALPLPLLSRTYLTRDLCRFAPPPLRCRLPGHRTLLARLLLAGLLRLLAALRLLQRPAACRPRRLPLRTRRTLRHSRLASSLRFDLPWRPVLALLLLRCFFTKSVIRARKREIGLIRQVLFLLLCHIRLLILPKEMSA